MKYAVVNLGCKVNRVESDTFAAALRAQGGTAADEADADIIVVNTCTVTGEAEQKTRKAVRHALRANEHARVIVTGCAAAIDAKAYTALDMRVEVIGKNDLLAKTPALLPVGEGFRTRVGVKVQDGCDNACTYCIVHVARGRATSRPADEVVRECVALAQAGVKEIVLTGINLGSYCDGARRDPKATRLSDLLVRLLRETEKITPPEDTLVRFRISSIEPRDVDDALIDLLASANGRICRHLHMPLQAGSDKVLREMARPYRVADYINLVDRLRAQVPQLSLSTDIIVGFPGETDDEFQETCAVARRCGFSKLHVFPYSMREGTPAAARRDQIAPSIKTARAAALRFLGEDLRRADFEQRIGNSELALVEEGGIATTESYYQVPVSAHAASGSLIAVTLVNAADGNEVGRCS